MLKRSVKFFPIIEPILEKNGIPEDFKYLALIESGLQNVVSPAGASGYWQIMKTTGTENGLTINSEIDERYHIVRSTEVGPLQQPHTIWEWEVQEENYKNKMLILTMIFC